jgi:peptidoglycan-associated lipoprotein
MNTKTRLLFILTLAVLMLVPSGCRSRGKTDVTIPAMVDPPVVERAVTPREDFADIVPDDGIDWNDLDELTRIAAARGWLRDAFYSYDSSLLTAEARDALANSARWLQENPQYTLLVEGHCDERGTQQYNLALGERRSHIAKEYLASLGVSPQRLRTISYGEERPFAVGSSENAWSQNRRAHLRISGKTD